MPPMNILAIISRGFALSKSAATCFNSERLRASLSCISVIRSSISTRHDSSMSAPHFLQCFRQMLFSCKQPGLGHSIRSTAPHWPQCFSFSLLVALHFGQATPMLIARLWSEEMAVTVPQYSQQERSRGNAPPQLGHDKATTCILLK
jgi:hypothetical protein